MQTIYICTGGCGGTVTADEYATGKTTCGAASCPHFGKPFETRQECETCGALVKPGEPHGH